MAHINSSRASPTSSLNSSGRSVATDDSSMDVVSAATATTASQRDGKDIKFSKTRLEQLRNHPLFGDLQLTLVQDCLNSSVPFTLLPESSPQKSPTTDLAFCTVSDKIIEQHVKVQTMLMGLQAYYPSLLGVYQQITEQVESQRYRALTYNCYSDYVKQMINWFYDNERQLLIDRIQEAVSDLSAKSASVPSLSDLQKLTGKRFPLPHRTIIPLVLVNISTSKMHVLTYRFLLRFFDQTMRLCFRV